LKNQDENPKWFRLPVLISRIITADKTYAHIQCPSSRKPWGHHLSSDHLSPHVLKVKCFPTPTKAATHKPDETRGELETSWALPEMS